MSARFRIEPILQEFGASIAPRSSKLKCPFHDDNHDSGYIPESRQYFKCLACGVQGDAVRLLHDQGEMSWRDAYAAAERLAGEPDESIPEQPVRGSRIPGRPRDYRGHSRFGKAGSGR